MPAPEPPSQCNDDAICVACSLPLAGAEKVRMGKSRLCACSTCGTWTYLPRSSAIEQAAIHDTESYFDHPYFEPRRSLSATALRRCRAKFQQITAATGIQEFRGQRLLDIGCDTGVFLEAAAQQFGVVPVGIDVSSRAVAAATQRGIEAYCCALESAPEHLSSFPVITVIDVIEHVTDPADLLRQIRGRLRPGGVAYLETPNIQSVVYRFGGWLSRVSQGRPAGLLTRLFPPQHLQYFTPDSLEALCRSAGFEVVSIHSRVLHWGDVAVSPVIRAGLTALQLLDCCLGAKILLSAVLKTQVDVG